MRLIVFQRMFVSDMEPLVGYIFNYAKATNVSLQEEIKTIKLRRQLYTDLVRDDEERPFEQDIISVTKQETMLDKCLAQW
jgi:hypothetical protein